MSLAFIAHYTRMALKALLRFKGHSLVSLFSLVFGFVCFISATLLINHVESFEQQFPNAENIFSLVQVATEPGAPFDSFPIVNEPAARYLRASFPELENAVRSTVSIPTDVTFDGQTDAFNVRYAEKEFFDIFPVQLLSGTASSESLPPGSLLITESAALRRFGTSDVVGKTATLNNQMDAIITDVIADFDHPTHLDSDIPLFATEMIVPVEYFDTMDENGPNEELNPETDRWGNQSYYVYLEFPAGEEVNVAAFNERLYDFVQDNVPPNWSDSMTYELMPVNQLMTSTLSIFTAGFSILSILQVAGALVLLIGCLNYSNLVIAQLSLRSQEIAVQKILGAKRSMLIAQYCWESLLFVSIAVAISLLVFVVLLASLGQAGIAGVSPAMLLDGGLWFTLAIVIAVVVMIAGFYPAIRTAMTALVTMMRPKGATGYSGKLRAAMVGTQFFISGTLMIMAIVMYRQNVAMTDQLDGSIADPRIAISVPLDTLEIDRELLIAQLESHASVVSITQVDRQPWTLGMSTSGFSLSADLNADAFQLATHSVGYDFPGTLNIPFLSGREFARERSTDVLPSIGDFESSTGPYAAIVDDKAARSMGFESAADAVGQTIYRRYGPPYVPERLAVEMNIVGIVGQQQYQFIDYSNLGVNGDIYLLQPQAANFLIVRASALNVNDALRHLDDTWASLLPDVPIKREFSDNLFYETYQLFLYLTSAIGGLAIFGFVIASIGLLGNATFITNIRQKEVGIRKVMGASTRRLTLMLLFDFARPVLIANAIACPLGYVIATTYVSLFNAQTPINAVPFLISFALSVLIAVTAVISQSWKSARVRPAMVLRYE